jgi:hypothetical protein
MAIGVDGVDTTQAAAEQAAADPAADMVTYGIPLTPVEAELARASIPEANALSGPAGLVSAYPDKFGSLWLDGGTLVISVLVPDQDLLRLARCLERPAFRDRVRYVSAGVSAAELSALADRISAERAMLADGGIDVTIVGSDPPTETVEVGVRVLTPEIQAHIIERYGTVIHVVQSLGPHPI